MTYVDKASGVRVTASDSSAEQVTREALILVVEDDFDASDAFRAVCECLEVAVERIPSHDDLGIALQRYRPMAVVAAMDAAGQDGCHVLMTVAAYDRDLPVLLIAGDDPALLGATDAVEEIWRLTSVIKCPRLPSVGTMVDFLFRAGRKGDCMRLLSV